MTTPNTGAAPECRPWYLGMGVQGHGGEGGHWEAPSDTEC